MRGLKDGVYQFVAPWKGYSSIYRHEQQEYEAGRTFVGGGHRVVTPVPDAPAIGIGRRTPINNWTDAVGHGSVIAMDPTTGQRRWTFAQFDVTDSGMLTTATDLLFTGGREGYFQALNARTGELLWKTQLGSSINSGPTTDRVGNKQYVEVVSGLSMFVFAVDE